MATYYINTDTGNDTTGDGSSGNPWATADHAFTNSISGDIFICDGSTVDTISLNTSFFYRTFIQNTSSPNRTYTAKLGASISAGGCNFYGIKFDVSTFTLLDPLTNGQIFWDNCEIFTTAVSTRTLQVFEGTPQDRAFMHSFFNTDFNLTNVRELGEANAFGLAMSFNNCNFYNWNSSSTQALVSATGHTFNRCKFYDITSTSDLVESLSTNDANNKVSFEHCTFLMSDNNCSIIQLTNPTIFRFINNIIAGEGITYTNMTTSLGTIFPFSVGNNLFSNATATTEYTNALTNADFTDLSSPFESTVVGNADFLKMVDTSNGKGASLFDDNLDLGAVQGAPTTPNYADPADVRSGTVYGGGTGTLVVPSAGDVRSGTSVDNTTGTLVVPAVGDVRLGTSVDAGTGTLIVPDVTEVAVGVEFDSDGSVGSAVFKEIQPGKVPLRIFTSDGSNIDGSFGPSQTFYLSNGSNIDTFLSSLGLSERIANGDATVIIDEENDLLKALRLER